MLPIELLSGIKRKVEIQKLYLLAWEADVLLLRVQAKPVETRGIFKDI